MACVGCSKCCRYVTIHIDEPEDKEDWDSIRWYVLHENVIVFLDNEGDWLVEFATPCEKLNADGSCSIYKDRPQVCRDYDPDNCENHGEGESYTVIFRNLEDVDEYLKKN